MATVLRDMEAFFLRCVKAGQDAGAISAALPADNLARMLLGLLMGLRVLARSRPERELLRGLVRPALALLDGDASPPRPLPINPVTMKASTQRVA